MATDQIALLRFELRLAWKKHDHEMWSASVGGRNIEHPRGSERVALTSPTVVGLASGH